MLVHLQSRDGPHVVHRALDSSLQSATLCVTIHQNHHLLSSHHCAYANGKSGLRNLINIVVEETAVGNNRICCQGLLTGTASQA